MNIFFLKQDDCHLMFGLEWSCALTATTLPFWTLLMYIYLPLKIRYSRSASLKAMFFLSLVRITACFSALIVLLLLYVAPIFHWLNFYLNLCSPSLFAGKIFWSITIYMMPISIIRENSSNHAFIHASDMDSWWYY